MDPRVAELLQRPENKVCADCREPSPRWASVSLGIVICTECAGIHRKLGTHISFVQSAALDKWKDAWVERLARVGNGVAAELYEARLPRAWSRPCCKVTGGDRVDVVAAAHLERFIRAKYELKLFAPHDPQSLQSSVLDAFYEGLRKQHASDRQRLEAAGANVSVAKRNQQDLYIDDTKRAAAYMASRAFLHAHADWAEGPAAFAKDGLTARVALHHFIAIDVEDLNLPVEQRRSNDSFEGSEDDVCEQFRKDATRSCFRIGEQEFKFAEEMQARGAAFEENSAEVKRLCEQFTERLADALRQSLRDCSSPNLCRVVSMVMSQSGMAHLERACMYCSAPVVVSGGQQIVRYELDVSSPTVFDLRLSLQKSGFSQAVVHAKSAGGVEEKPQLVAKCLPESHLGKSCSLRLNIDSMGCIWVDVTALDEQMHILDADDESGRPVGDASVVEPCVEGFQVLLRKGEGERPFGLAPDREALRRGVLKLRAGVAPGTAAEQWNECREVTATQLQAGDFITSINGVLVSRDDAGAAALQELKQQQAVLVVKRLRPQDGPLSYEGLVVAAFALFNPAKLDSVVELLAKQPARTLFLRVCGKYAVKPEDWRDILRCFMDIDHCSDTARVVAKAEERLNQMKAGEEMSLLKAVCRRLVEGVRRQSKPAAAQPETECNGKTAPDSGQGHSHDYLKWPRVVLSLHLADPSAPLGMRHDRNSLQERQVLSVREVLPDTPAAAAGLLCGDVIDKVGDNDAATFILGGSKMAAAADTGGILKLTIRRSAALFKAAPTHADAEIQSLREQLEEARRAAAAVTPPRGGAKQETSPQVDSEVSVLRAELEEARQTAANKAAAVSEDAPAADDPSELAALRKQLEEARQAAAAGASTCPAAESELSGLKRQLEEAKAATANSIASDAEVAALRAELAEAWRFKGEEDAMRAERTRLEHLVEEAHAKRSELGEQESRLRIMTEERELTLLEEEAEQLRMRDALQQERELLELQRRQVHTLTKEARLRVSFSAQMEGTPPGVCQELRLDDSDGDEAETRSDGHSDTDEVDAWDLDWSAVKSEGPSAGLVAEAESEEQLL